jgi:squalene-hopene/tetraprenyl-beta-curcumene cyclase
MGKFISLQNPDGGWGGDKSVEPSIEETALAIEGLAAFSQIQNLDVNIKSPPLLKSFLYQAIEHGVDWLIKKTNLGQDLRPSPIGLYFARLWYYEELYPQIFSLWALNKVNKIQKLISAGC